MHKVFYWISCQTSDTKTNRRQAEKKEILLFLFHFLLLFHVLVHCFYSIFFYTYLNNEIGEKSLFPRTQKDCIFSFLTGEEGKQGRIEEGGFFTSFTNRQTDGDRETDRRSKSWEGGGVQDKRGRRGGARERERVKVWQCALSCLRKMKPSSSQTHF